MAASPVYPSLKGKKVLITGGAAGIGADLVGRFCHQGAFVSFVDIKAQEAALLAQKISNSGLAKPKFEVCDVSDVEAFNTTIRSLVQASNGFDILVNNAGHDAPKAWEEVTPEDWDYHVSVNLRHLYFAIQQVANTMKERRQGSIINLGSISWMIGAPGVTAYATMKSAVSGLTKTFARELGTHDIRVNAIAPGWVLTDRQLQKGADNPDKFEQYLAKQCLKQHLFPEDISNLCLWLASEQSKMLTGQTIILDGGVI